MTTHGSFGTLLDWHGGGLTMHEWHERLGGPAPWLATLLERTDAYATHLPPTRPGQRPRKVVRMPDGRFVAESPIGRALPITINAEEVRLWTLNPSALHRVLVVALGLVPVQGDILSGECFGCIRTSPRGQVPVRVISVQNDALVNERIAYLASVAPKPEVYLTPHVCLLSQAASALCSAKCCAVSSLDECVDAAGIEPRSSQRWKALVSSFMAAPTTKKPRRRSSVLLNVKKIREELDAEKKSRLTLIAEAWMAERPLPQFEEYTQKELARRANLDEPTLSKLLHDPDFKHLLHSFKLVNDPERLLRLISKSQR